MKKLTAILTVLCLLCGTCAAMADTTPPTFDSMPAVVLEDDNTTISETAYEGTWVVNASFLSTEYIDQGTVYDTYGLYTFIPITIADGKIRQDVQNENGEFVTVEKAYTFEAGQLWFTDDTGLDCVIELLVDGNIVMSVFLPGEGEAKVCLSLFMVHPDE